MTGYDCPVEGCDYAADQIDQLRGHINGSPDHPSWGAVQGDLDAGSELVDGNDLGETTPSEGDESPDENGDDDQPDDPSEGDDEGADEESSGPSDAGSEDDDQQNDQNDQQDTPMPTDDELQRQHRVQGAQPDESGSNDETSKKPISTNRSTPSKGGESTGLLPAIDTSTIIMLVVALAVALILYRLLAGDGDDEGSARVDDGAEETEDDEEVDDLPNFDATELEDI